MMFCGLDLQVMVFDEPSLCQHCNSVADNSRFLMEEPILHIS
jgi:hypothetical protein